MVNVLGAKDYGGTTFHAVGMVREGGGSFASAKCLAKFHAFWVAGVGYPAILACNRGLSQGHIGERRRPAGG